MPSNLWAGQWNGRGSLGDVHQRARNIVRSTGAIVRGKFPSRKNGRMVHHEGLLELAAIYLFETSPRVVRYREQPATILFPDGGRLRRYTPDFELELRSGKTVLVEVKPFERLADVDVRHKLDCVMTHLAGSGQRLVILTDQCLRQEPRLANLRWLYHRASRTSPTADRANVALSVHRDRFPTAIHLATALLASQGVDPFSLVLAGLLQVPLNVAISLETELSLITEGEHEWFFIAPEHGF